MLNNDVVVTTGWLFRLLRALHSDPAIGLVGAVLEFREWAAAGGTRYDSLADLDGFAWDWGGAHEGQRVDVDRLVGFCLLIKREVADAIGLLDEQFGIGCFEDDDYCLRAIQAGYRAVIRATRSSITSADGRLLAAGWTAEHLRENGERFREKWAGRADGRPDGRRRAVGDPAHGRHRRRPRSGPWPAPEARVGASGTRPAPPHGGGCCAARGSAAFVPSMPRRAVV